MKYTPGVAKRQFTLTEEEIRVFRQAEQQTTKARELKHLQRVRLYGTGKPVNEIIDLLNYGKSTLLGWVSRYQASGIVGLCNQWRGENANKLTVEQRHDLKHRLQTQRPDQVLPPTERTSEGPFWTIDDLHLESMIW